MPVGPPHPLHQTAALFVEHLVEAAGVADADEPISAFTVQPFADFFVTGALEFATARRASDSQITLHQARSSLGDWVTGSRGANAWGLALLRAFQKIDRSVAATAESLQRGESVGPVVRGRILQERYLVGPRVGRGDETVTFLANDRRGRGTVELTVFQDPMTHGEYIELRTLGPRTIMNLALLGTNEDEDAWAYGHVGQHRARLVAEKLEEARGSGLYPELLDRFQVEGHDVIVTECVPGENLLYLSERKNEWPLAWLADVARQLSADVPYHGNLKPDAMVICPKSESITLVEPSVSFDAELEGIGARILTPAYNPLAFRDSEGDVIALGCILFERLVGKSPPHPKSGERPTIGATDAQTRSLLMLANQALYNDPPMTVEDFSGRLDHALKL